MDVARHDLKTLRDKNCKVLRSAIKLLTILRARGKGVWGWNVRENIVQVIHLLKKKTRPLVKKTDFQIEILILLPA